MEEKKSKKSLNELRKVLIKKFRNYAIETSKFVNRFGILTYVLVWILTLIIGFAGYLFLVPASIPGSDKAFSDPLAWSTQYFLPNILQYITYLQNIAYSAIQLVILKPQVAGDISKNITGLNPMVDLARWLALFLAFSTACVIILNYFSGKTYDWFVKTMEEHVIVCGTGRIGSRVAREFGKKYPVVIIEKNERSEALQSLKESGAFIVHGNAMDPEVLKKAGIEKAKYLIPALGDDEDNAEVAVQAGELIKGKDREPLTCLVHIVDPNLCHLLKVKDMDKENESNMRLEFFSIYESGAEALLYDFEFFDPFSKEKQTPHMMVIGLGDMGESLVIQSARRWWKFIYHDGHAKLTITVIDKKARQKVDSLCMRYPSIDKCCDFRCFDLDVGTPEFLAGSFLRMESNKPPVNIAFVCLMDDSEGLSTALMLNNQFGLKDIPIVVRLNSDSGLATFLNNKSYTIEEFENVHAFGLWDRTCTYDLVSNGTHEAIARAIHEEYLLNQLNKGEKEGARYTLVKWEVLSEEDKDNNRDPADHLNEKMKAILCGLSRRTDWEGELFTFTPEEIIKLAIIEHKRWYVFKKRYKWELDRKLEKADFATHRHPYLLSWEELDAPTKLKDIEAVMSLPTILSRVDMKIYRKDIHDLIARALYRIENEKKKPDKQKPWNLLEEGNKRSFTEKAKRIKAAIDKCGYGVTGVISRKSPGSDDTKIDLEKLARSYYETCEEQITPPGAVLSFTSWDNLSQEVKSKYLDLVGEWPQVFAGLDMKIYDREKKRMDYAEEFKILEELKKKLVREQAAEAPRIQASS